MLCDKCGKFEATTHIKTIVNGVVSEQNLCSECAQKEGYGKMGTIGLSDMLSTMFGENLHTKESNMRCEGCGSSFEDIARTGKAGCAKCYETFYDRLAPHLKRMHGSIKHTGRGIDTDGKNLKDEIGELKAQLAKLIKEENFEEAAIVRDKIREIEAGEEK